MGTNEPLAAESGIASALFTPVQGRLLGLLFSQPDRRFQSAELIRRIGSGTGAVIRQLQRLEGAGLVNVAREGNQKYYQANRDSPVFSELHGLVVKTVGIVEPLREALEPLARHVEVAFVYGSVAKGTDRAESDVDVLIVSDSVGHLEVIEALQAAEAVLARQVNPTVVTREEWRRKRSEPDSFAKRIADQPRLFVLGNDHDVP